MISALVVILLVGLVLLAVIAAVAPGYFRLDGQRPTRHLVTTRDGWTLAVWHRPAEHRRFAEPVVLCHGLGNNHSIVEFLEDASLAASLSRRGFECYTLDLRGAGDSRVPDLGPFDATFDDHLHFDLPAALDFIRGHANQKKVLWVGHSMGGLLGLAYAGTRPDHDFAGLVTVGSPVFFHLHWAVTRSLTFAKWLAADGRFPLPPLAALGTLLAGRLPPPRAASPTANLKNIAPAAQRMLLARSFAPLWRGVLAQLEDWVEHDAFRSVDRSVDYRAGVSRLTLPVFVIGGTVDGLAPPKVTREYFELLTTKDKELVLLGREGGQELDYGHGDLMVGKNARHEVYPRIGDWLEKRATLLDGARAVLEPEAQAPAAL